MRDFASLRRRRTLPQSWFRPVLSGWTRHSPFAQCFPALRHHEAGHCSLSDFSRYFTFAAPAHTSTIVDGRKVPWSMYYVGRGKDGQVRTSTKPHNAALMTEAFAEMFVTKLNITGHDCWTFRADQWSGMRQRTSRTKTEVFCLPPRCPVRRGTQLNPRRTGADVPAFR
jgi:hypothetical protein